MASFIDTNDFIKRIKKYNGKYGVKANEQIKKTGFPKKLFKNDLA